MKKSVVVLFLILASMCFAQETYTLRSESTLTIEGTSTVHDWTVTANEMEGTLNFDGDIVTLIAFEVGVERIVSERGSAMDKKMHNALKKDVHPKVIFKSPVTKSITTAENSYTIKGMLTIAGVENEVSIPSEITQLDGIVRIKGEKKIKLQNFDMEQPTAMFGSIVVGDDVVIKFDLSFSKD